MSDETLVQIVCVGIPAIIAALSSLRNGKEQKRVRQELAEVNGKVSGGTNPVKKRPKKNGQQPDWYQPPDLGP